MNVPTLAPAVAGRSPVEATTQAQVPSPGANGGAATATKPKRYPTAVVLGLVLGGVGLIVVLVLAVGGVGLVLFLSSKKASSTEKDAGATAPGAPRVVDSHEALLLDEFALLREITDILSKARDNASSERARASVKLSKRKPR